MYLGSETERLEKFVEIYGEKPEVFPVDAGINSSGFKLATFVPKTKYAQFVSNGWWLSPREIIEFAKYAKIPEGKEEITVKRRRLYDMYGMLGMKLTQAEVEFPLKDGYMAQWRVLFGKDGKNNQRFPHPRIELRFLASSESVPLVFALCEYIWVGGHPQRIYLTGGDLEQAKKTRAEISPYFQNGFVPSGVILERVLGSRVYNVKERKDPPCVVVSNWEEHRVTVVRVNKESRHKMDLKAPRFDHNWLARLRGSWEDFTQLTQDYPVDFGFVRT